MLPAAAGGMSMNPMMAQMAMHMMQQQNTQPQQMSAAAPAMPMGRPQNPQLQQQLQMAQGQMPAYSQFRPFGFTG
ncbi:hypothetical protein QZM97_26235 [Burkholderia orbicola]|nr:hypothetical protein [Burkholderia orbicola]